MNAVFKLVNVHLSNDQWGLENCRPYIRRNPPLICLYVCISSFLPLQISADFYKGQIFADTQATFYIMPILRDLPR